MTKIHKIKFEYLTPTAIHVRNTAHASKHPQQIYRFNVQNEPCTQIVYFVDWVIKYCDTEKISCKALAVTISPSFREASWQKSDCANSIELLYPYFFPKLGVTKYQEVLPINADPTYYIEHIFVLDFYNQHVDLTVFLGHIDDPQLSFC